MRVKRSKWKREEVEVVVTPLPEVVRVMEEATGEPRVEFPTTRLPLRLMFVLVAGAMMPVPESVPVESRVSAPVPVAEPEPLVTLRVPPEMVVPPV